MKKKTIYFAGGCFWGVEAYFKLLKGVLDTEVGYANGENIRPKYEEVKTHQYSHAETCKIDYDEEIISLETLIEHYLRFVDPYSIDKQGHDVGHQYRSGIYYKDLKDEQIIIRKLEKMLQKPYKIEVLPLKNFYNAEDYHQDYLDKNPHGYCHVNLSLIKENEKKD